MSYGFGRGFLAACALTAFAGCAAPVDGDATDTSEAAQTSAATLHFTSDYQVQVSGSLRRGGKLRVDYDAARLTTCRGDQGGVPQWAITGYWRLAGGPVHAWGAAGLNTSSPDVALDRTGDLEIWFENTSRWGCDAFDSDFGRNFHFAVSPADGDPGWIGNARAVMSRATCNGGPCDADLRDASGDILYDTWARQRAAIREITFEVWAQGVTDFDNAELWKALDVEVHSRVAGAGSSAFTTSYVSFDRRLGNNARYALDLRGLDPLPDGNTLTSASQCPAVPLAIVPESNGAYVETDVELYFTVNGVELRPANAAGLFRVRYQNYAGLFQPCIH